MKKFLIPGIAALVIIIGIIAFLLMKPGSSISPATPGTGSQTNKLEGKSIRDLIGFVGNQECTFSDEMGNSGTVSGSNGKVRGDFTGTTNGQTQATHVIYDGTDMYVWFDGATEGFKASMESMESMQGQNADNNFDMNQQVDYKCGSWSTDQSKFQLPAGVKFNDFGSMMVPSGGAMMEDDKDNAEDVAGSDDAKEAQCAACSSLPEGAVRDQCRKALSC